MVVCRLHPVLIEGIDVLKVNVADNTVVVSVQFVLLQPLKGLVVLGITDADIASNLLRLNRKLHTRLVCPKCLVFWRWFIARLDLWLLDFLD